MKRILIATDGSPSALEALEYGLELAAEHDAAVTVAYVVPGVDVYPTGGFGFGLTGAVPHEVTPADSEPLDEALRLAEEADVSACTALLHGEPADEIVAYADSLDADMIVVGSRGQGRLASALLGGVSRAILREARRPVLVVRGSRAPAEVAA
jgi:nucleotide-binding universal stress UspA family protein